MTYTQKADWPHLPGRTYPMPAPTELHPTLFHLTITDADGQEITRLTTRHAHDVSRTVEDFVEVEGLDNKGGRRYRRTPELRRNIDALIRGEGPIEMQGFTIHVTTTKGN